RPRTAARSFAFLETSESSWSHDHSTLRMAVRATMTASARKSRAVATCPKTPSLCRKGTALPTAWKGPMVLVPTSTANTIPAMDPAGDQPRAKERAGAQLRLLRLSGRSFHPRPDQSSREDRCRRCDRKVRADGERKGTNAAKLERQREKDTDEHQAPRQILIEQ